MPAWVSNLLVRFFTTDCSLPYEVSTRPVPRRQALVIAIVLVGLSLLEVGAHLLRGAVDVVACRLWSLQGCIIVVWLLWVFVSVTWEDVRRGRLWVLLPVVLAVPLCFFNVHGFGALNSESLSELQHAFERLRQPDWGYTDIFWDVYPSRSFLPNIVPTLVAGISPAAYRLGFSIPVFLGLLFFYSGLRRCFEAHRFASALAALATASVVTYPVVCSVTRTFEMAVSSFAFGLWAIGALLLCVHRPSVLSVLAAAWTAGFLSATFTPALALAVLIWICVVLWLLRCAARKEWDVAAMVAGLLLYVTVVGIGMYLIRRSPLHPKDVDFRGMMNNFVNALGMVASINQSPFSNVFTPAILVFPTLLTVGYALSGRGGFLQLIGVLWCFPAIWASVNLHGKVSPELPFVLYRVIVIVPVLAYCMFRLGLSLAGTRPEGGAVWGWCGMFMAAAIGLGLTVLGEFRMFGVFQPLRAPIQAEAMIQHVFNHLPEMGLTPFSDAVLVDRTRKYDLQRIRPLSWYFLPGWTRAQPDQPLFCKDPKNGRPGIVFVLPGDPLINETPDWYDVKVENLSVPLDSSRIDVVQLLYAPKTKLDR
jgi:hypothetical protein